MFRVVSIPAQGSGATNSFRDSSGAHGDRGERFLLASGKSRMSGQQAYHTVNGPDGLSASDSFRSPLLREEVFRYHLLRKVSGISEIQGGSPAFAALPEKLAPVLPQTFPVSLAATA